MSTYRYILEPYKGLNTRYDCPGCSKRKEYTRYIDTETGQHISPVVGKCNREVNCGYHYTPKQYFQDNPTVNESVKDSFYTNTRARAKCSVLTPQKPASLIPAEAFEKSRNNYDENCLVNYLNGLFGPTVTNNLIARYLIATSKHWPGATVFWQVDTKGKIRAGKIMLYSPITGKRVKEPYNHITWAHSVLGIEGFNLKQCFFGEHLLQDKTSPIAIVESEKTALIASVYFPQMIWLAVGSLTNLNADKCTLLKGRNVILFPDLNGFEKWNTKIREFSHIARFVVSDLLERKATEAEKKQGLDLADYLIRFDYSYFQQSTQPKELRHSTDMLTNVNLLKADKNANNSDKAVKNEEETGKLYENWDQAISELEVYFEEITLPAQPMKLNAYNTITNMSLFIESHFTLLKANSGKRFALPCLERLQELKLILTKQ